MLGGLAISRGVLRQCFFALLAFSALPAWLFTALPPSALSAFSGCITARIPFALPRIRLAFPLHNGSHSPCIGSHSVRIPCAILGVSGCLGVGSGCLGVWVSALGVGCRLWAVALGVGSPPPPAYAQSLKTKKAGYQTPCFLYTRAPLITPNRVVLARSVRVAQFLPASYLLHFQVSWIISTPCNLSFCSISSEHSASCGHTRQNRFLLP